MWFPASAGTQASCVRRTNGKRKPRSLAATVRIHPETTRGEESEEVHSAALVEDLTAHRTAALRAELATRPDVVAVAHKLALQLCYEAPCYRIGSCLSLASEKGGCNLEANATRIENSPAETRVAEIRKQWMELLPDDPDALWDWLLEKEQSVVLELLAFCVGQTVHAVRLAHDSRNEPRFLGRCVTRTIF
jgi:hypothetical protein